MARSKTANKTTANKGLKAQAGANLDSIEKALAANDASAALLAALLIWRASRSPELANLIDVLDTRIAFPAIHDDLEWTEVAFRKNPLALGRLLSMIGELPVSFLPTVIAKLAAFDDDPRIGTAATGWILEPPTLSSSTYPFWTGLYKLLERLGDTRVIPAITKRRKMAQPKTKKWAGDKNPKPSLFWDKFYGHIEKTKSKLSELTAPTIDKAALAKLDKLARKLPMAEVKATKAAVTGGTKASTGEKGPALSRALTHATKQQVPETIAALLDAWRDKRAPELADLLDRATRLLPIDRATFPAAPKPAAAAWQAAFDRDPVGELPRLVRHVHVGGAAEATEHVIALSTLPDDPRIAMRLAELATNITISPERGHYWKATWDLIARTRDTRVIAPLRQDFDDFSGTYYDHHRSGKRLLGDFLLAATASPLDAVDHKTINQLTAALDKITPEHLERERTLIADIVANWDDEGPRLVYADWLIERDHLRGPLIVLSCKQHRDKQLSKSEAKQLSTLRGGFRAPAYPFGSLSDFKHVIDRGLPTQLKVTWNENPITWRYLPGEPLLSCIDAIDFDTPDRRGRPAAEDVARVMLDPLATRLVRVTNVPNDTVNMTSDPRFAPRAAAVRLADALEPLVKSRWKRDARNFLRT